MIKTGISQIGGKFRLRKVLLNHTPIHEFFLSMFAGSCIYEVNKPRCRYECFNDKDADLINYLLMTREYPKEFDEMKQGVLGLVSQEICNRIVNGKLQAKNDLERAYFFYYLNKLSYGGDYEIKGFHGILDQKLQPERIDNPAIEKIKAHYCGIMRPTDPIRQPQVEKIKSQYRGVVLPTVCKEKSINEAKASFAGINNTRALGNSANKRDLDKWKKEFKAAYKGTQPDGMQVRKTDVERAKKQFNASYKGINPKTTRPYKNNDCGLLTPLDKKCIKRLRYVNLTAYDFRRVYDLFYKAFHERKGLTIECFIYADPPYVGTEKYYGNRFPPELHQELINRMLKTPFNFMLSIGGNCEELYVEPLKAAGWIIKEVYTKYSTDANSQEPVKEYLIMNYDIDKIPKMIQDNQVDILSFGGK